MRAILGPPRINSLFRVTSLIRTRVGRSGLFFILFFILVAGMLLLLLFVVWLYLKWSSKTGLNLMTMVPLIIREKKNI